MKTTTQKNKALELYIDNVSSVEIAKQLGINRDTFYKWRNKGNWEELKKNAIQEAHKKTTDDMIEGQTTIALVAQRILAGRLLNEERLVKNPELVSIMKHGLEVVRPKQTTNNLNITKNEENTQIEIIIPKEVKELLDGEIQSNS